MEEKDTSIALLEISDGFHCHRDEIVELQQQKNVLMKMIKQHVSVTMCPPVCSVSLSLYR